MESNSLTASSSLSRSPCVCELDGTSTSSATIISAREPVSWDVTPNDLTEGAWEAGAPLTSKAILLNRWFSDGCRCCRAGMSCIRRNVKVEKSSDLFLLADTTSMFFVWSSSSWWTTNADVIQLLPHPRNAWITERRGPFCKYKAMSYCNGVGSGRLRCRHTRHRKFLKSRSCGGISWCFFFIITIKRSRRYIADSFRVYGNVGKS